MTARDQDLTLASLFAPSSLPRYAVEPRSHRLMVLNDEGDEVECCGRCCGLGRVADHPCTCGLGEPGRTP